MDIGHLSSSVQNVAAGYADASALQVLRRPAVVDAQSVTQLPQAAQAAAAPAALDSSLGRHLDVKV